MAGALLEALDEKGCSGVFATHLHEILDLPLNVSSRVDRRRMGVQWVPSPAPFLDASRTAAPLKEPVWTYQLERGTSTDSLALVTGRRFGLSDALLARAAALAEDFDVACRPGSQQSTPIVVTSGESAPLSEAATGAVEGLDLAELTLRDLVGIEAAQTGSGAGRVVSRVPPRWSPPPSLQSGTSVVYVLEVPVFESTGDSVRYYVGETDSLGQRLGQHRAKRSGAGAQAFNWADCSAVVAEASNKSAARALESSLIQSLAAQGLPLISVHDGNNRNFGK